MSNRFIKTTLSILLITLITSLSLAVNADIPLHEDPSTLGEEVDPYFLMLFYTYVFKSLLHPEMYNLTQLMNLYENMFIPRNLQFIVSRFNDLILELNREVNSTRLHIDRAKLYVNYKDYSDALGELHEAKRWLAKANITLSELDTAFNELLRALPRFGPITDKFTEARIELLSLLDEIKSLLRHLMELINTYEETASREYGKYYLGNETTLSIYVNSTRVWVDSHLLVYGELTSLGSPLPHRPVYITYLDRSYRVETDDFGRYSGVIYIPPIYVKSLTVNVFYTPEGEDIGVYRPSRNSTTMELLYYSTVISLNVESPAHPGLNTSIGVEVHPWGESLRRDVAISLDDILIASFTLNTSSHTINYHVPPNSSTGYHVLSAYVSPIGRYSGARTYESLLITYVPPTIEVNMSPTTVFYPLSTIHINGSVRGVDSKPLRDARVEVSVGGDKYEAYTDSRGGFTIAASPPQVIGAFSMVLVVDPREPWYGTAVKLLSIYVVNLPLLILAVATLPILTYLILIVISRRRRETGVEAPASGVPMPEATSIGEMPKEHPPRTVEEYSGESVLGIYYRAVKLLSRKIEPPRAYETLREFYLRAYHVLNGFSDEFWRLTLLAEYTLYSGRESPMENLSEAKTIFSRLVSVLGEG